MATKTLGAKIAFDDIQSRLHFTYVALELAGDDGDKEVAALLPPIGKLLGRWQELDRDKTAQGLAATRAVVVDLDRLDLDLLGDQALDVAHQAHVVAVDQGDRQA